MTKCLVPFGLRMQPDLRLMIEQAIAASGRSNNVEICTRRQQSFELDAGKTDEILAIAKEVLEVVKALKPARQKK
jgi:hypothetical protein